ncbi:MAG: hypothetical protein ACR2LK_00670 [Solirubrobacteraceae bacterium]
MIGLRRYRALAIALLIAALTLAACGGDDSPGDDKPSASDRAQDRKDIARLIKQATGPNEDARSAQIDATIDLEVEGVPRYKGPILLTANGSFELAAGADVPDVNLDVGLMLNEKAIGGSLIIADSKSFIALGDTGYRLPGDINEKIIAPAADLDNGLIKSAGMLYIRPDRWQKNGRIVGLEEIDGVQTEHARSDIRADRFFTDVSRLVRLLTLLRVTEAVGLPQKIGPKARAALARSVESAQGDIFVGKEDHVVRKATLEGSLVVAKKDQAILGGMTGAKLSADINISRVGEPQDVGAPKKLGSYANLQLSLDALGESIRRDLRGK